MSKSALSPHKGSFLRGFEKGFSEGFLGFISPLLTLPKNDAGKWAHIPSSAKTKKTLIVIKGDVRRTIA